MAINKIYQSYYTSLQYANVIAHLLIHRKAECICGLKNLCNLSFDTYFIFQML